MRINRLRQIIKEEFSRLLQEAGEDDEPQVRVRSKDRNADVWDADAPNEPLQTQTPPPGGNQQRRRRNLSRPNVNLRNMGRGKVDANLQGTVDPNFDFDTEFEQGLESEFSVDPTSEEMLGRPPERNVDLGGNPEQKRFQTNQPSAVGSTALGGRIQHPWMTGNATADIRTILEKEFVSPAMGVGMRLLPAVWQELTRMSRQDPATFVDAFSAALNEVRMVENTWFSELLGMQFVPTRMAPPEGSSLKTIYDRIIHVLRKYYDAVLAAVAENGVNLKDQLMSVKETHGEEEFKRAFFEVLSETRDQEDNAFASFMGAQRRLR